MPKTTHESTKNIRVGVFGASRGKAFIKALALIDGADVTGVCDKNKKRVEEALALCPPDAKAYETFDELLQSGIDAVILSNYFNEHAEYAIKALESGVAVLSETMAASTLAKCVALVRTVERTKGIYVFAENYPYSRGAWELARLAHSGTLGKICFAEGEYEHPSSPSETAQIELCEERHWRRYLPATYYSSHALAPLLFATEDIPRRVVAMCAKATPEFVRDYQRIRNDIAGVMLIYTESGAVFRVNGSTYLAPKGNWYRLSGINGSAETVRGEEKKVRLCYNPWCCPEGAEKEKITEAVYPSNEEEASKCGHGGGDYWITRQFIECVRERKSHFFDVYRAVQLSEVAIFGWRSALAGGVPFDIPDFSDEEQRRLYENDDATPFPSENSENIIPCSVN